MQHWNVVWDHKNDHKKSLGSTRYLVNSKFDRLDVVNAIFKQIVAGVSAIHHNKIAHRDLKPDNILFDSKFNVKIADFGFAKNFDKRQLRTELGTRT